MATGQCPLCGGTLHLAMHREASATTAEFRMWKCDNFFRCKGTLNEYGGVPFTRQPHKRQAVKNKRQREFLF